MDKDVKHTPAISVILPVYNAEKYLRECIASILSQSFVDFELIIINDGSRDESERIIKSFGDARIKYVVNEGNLGLISTLNKAIGLCRGDFIARMDADDVCLPERFAEQIRYMHTHPACALLGTAFYQLHGTKRVRKILYAGDDVLRAELLFRSAFAHPTVMMRGAVLKSSALHYDPAYRHAEDYELWARISEVAEVANLVEPLLLYRMHDQQVTAVHAKEKEETRDRILYRQLKKLNIDFSPAEFDVHRKLSNGISGNLEFLVGAENWLKKLVAQNDSVKYTSASALRAVAGLHWMKACENSGQGRRAWKMFRRSEFARCVSPGVRAYFRMAVKVVTRYKQHG